MSVEPGSLGPAEIAEVLRLWAARTDWCDWVELAGSLARDAADAYSDVDAGLGVDVTGSSYVARRDAALAAVSEFADVADQLVQHLGTDDRPADHLVVQYVDGRQLSLVVMPAENRPGLPSGAKSLFDRSGRLATRYEPPTLRASADNRREWAFLAWWALADVAKHVARAKLWRAIESLHEARTYAWRLHAADLGLDYSTFGAVSVENAGLNPPDGMAETVPALVEAAAIRTAAVALSAVLEPLTTSLDVGGVRAEAHRRLTDVTWSVGR